MNNVVDDTFEDFITHPTHDTFLFPVGKLRFAPDVGREVDLAFARECLLRHAAGQWGDTDRSTKWRNYRTLRGDDNQPIVSTYRVGNLNLQITTRLDGWGTSFGPTTTIVLVDAAKSSSPPDDELPVRFAAYEIHGVLDLDGNKIKVPEQDAECWGIFGVVPDQDLILLGDFQTLGRAEEVYARITGQRYGSHP